MARLKRDDLVKQFDDLVKQEIKNHNDSILATNVAINEIKEQIENIQVISANNISLQEKKFKQYENEVDNLKKEYSKFQHRNEVQVDNLKSDYKDFKDDVERNVDRVEENAVDEQSFLDAIDKHNQMLNTMKSEIVNLKNHVHLSIGKLKTEVDRVLDDFKEEQRNQPNELWDVKKYLEEKIDVSIVDAQGILREINVFRKDVFVMEKHVENIYKLLGRTKNGGKI